MVKDEEARPWTDAPEPFGDGAGSTLDHEREVLEATGIDGLVLRYGQFYGPAHLLRRRTGASPSRCVERRFPIVGRAAGNVLVHPRRGRRLGDASPPSSAGRPGIYNVVDDEPAPRARLAARLRGGAGRKAAAPGAELAGADLSPGRFAVIMATELRGASNAKAKRELGWEPRYPSWREGFREALG